MVATQNRGPLSVRLSSVSFLIIASALMLAGMIDHPRHYSLGPISMLGGLMIVFIVAPILCWFVKPRLHRSFVAVIAPLLLYIAWSLLTVSWSLPDLTGVQNLLAPIASCSLALLAYLYSRSHAGGWWRITKVLLLATALAIALYGFNIVSAGFGTSVVIGARTFALFALFGLAACLGAWRYGWKPGLLGALVITLTIGASLSRMALAIALLFFLMAQIPLGDWRGGIRLLAMTVVVGLVAYQLVMHVEPIRARFMEGDTSLQVAGININATGRTVLWNALLESYAESPWIGKGAGMGGRLINIRYPGLGQAHSDYLRILHDLGILGLTLWVLGMLNLLVTLIRGWVTADQRGDPAAAIHLASILALFGVAISMATDNPLVYLFVMGPFGIMLGASLGAMRRTPQ